MNLRAAWQEDNLASVLFIGDGLEEILRQRLQIQVASGLGMERIAVQSTDICPAPGLVSGSRMGKRWNASQAFPVRTQR